MSDQAMIAPLNSRDKVDAYLRLYERQMAHYENTQGIEWKVNVGVWTLLAAATGFVAEHHFISRQLPAWSWPIALALLVVAHVLWLKLMHASEEKDKSLWCQYRAEAETALGASNVQGHTHRGKLKETLWLVSEAGITAGIALVLWLIVTTPLPSAL